MKNNKKLVLGSVVALALSVGVVAPSLTKADQAPKVVAPAAKVLTPEEAKTQGKKATDAANLAINLAVEKEKAKNKFEKDPTHSAAIDNLSTLYDVDQYVQKNYGKFIEAKVAAAKAAAKAELAGKGLDKSQYEKDIDAAKTVYDVMKVKEEKLKLVKPSVTIDEFNLNEAKKEAKAKL